MSESASVAPKVRQGLRQRLSLAWSRNGWLGIRILVAASSILAAALLVFAATQALPEDLAQVILGQNATPAALEALRQQLGVDRPVLHQLFSWLDGLLHGSLGKSLASGRPVVELLATRGRNTLILIFLASLIVFPLSVSVGALAAMRRGGWLDSTLSVVSLVLTALPEFVIALGLVVVFSTAMFRMLPAVSMFPPEDSPLLHPIALLLPVATVVICCVPYMMRLTRSTMAIQLESDYAQFARMKGLPEWTVALRHCLRNTGPALSQGVALSLAYMAGGMVIVESVFAYPGIGSLLVDAISKRDIAVIQGCVLFLAAFYVLVNTVADVASHFLTPKLRSGNEHGH